MEELCSYNMNDLIVGVLGGAKGTTRDTFELIRQSEKYGARVALFGRKINNAESPVKLVELMRTVVEGIHKPAEAVKIYHTYLSDKGIESKLSLENDLQVTEKVLLNDL